MKQIPTPKYLVEITANSSDIPERGNYNSSFPSTQEIEAENYFNTLVERYKCYRYSNPSPGTKQATGDDYTITLTTTFDE